MRNLAAFDADVAKRRVYWFDLYVFSMWDNVVVQGEDVEATVRLERGGSTCG